MKYYRIARIVNSFGIRGEVKVISDTDFPEERFALGNKLYILKDTLKVAQVTIESARRNKGTYILKFQEYNNINQIEAFKNHWLAIDEDQQEDLDEGHYYYHQIEGLKVFTQEGEYLGHIKEIIALGSNDVWVVQAAESHRRDILLPYIDDVVKEVDLSQGKVIVELMEGLLEDEN